MTGCPQHRLPLDFQHGIWVVCRNPQSGYARYVCPQCGDERIVPFSCKTRFCPSPITAQSRMNWVVKRTGSVCGKVHTDEWVTRIAKELLDVPHLPAGKTLATFDQKGLPLRIRRQLPNLCSGEFVDRAENILVFGLPGRGETHLASAVGFELIQQGRSVLFTSTYRVVGQLLRAKRDLELEHALRRFDRFEVLILDDIGYVQQSREEMEVLFTLLAERYERRSVIITSNLVFSAWDQIFKDPMTTAAAIDRVAQSSVDCTVATSMETVRTHRCPDKGRRRSAVL